MDAWVDKKSKCNPFWEKGEAQFRYLKEKRRRFMNYRKIRGTEEESNSNDE